MKKLAKPQDQKSTENDAITRTCFAFGCPLPGSITDTLYGPQSEATWLCRFHHGKPSHDWPAITEWITQNIKKINGLTAEENPPNPFEKLSPKQCRAEIKRIQSSPKPPPTQWAFKLKQLEAQGKP
ncbi:MAG: hypothetical protein NZ553_17110, partial [Caldilinea sp.]|nr:hypothetical protein [Caldilinea sp.]MDW8442201.1 hypothetical protein [Caldilineaceae bacterium]